MNMIEQTYEITEEILSDIEAQGDINYSLLVRSLVAEIRRLQAAAAPATEAPAVASEPISEGDAVMVKETGERGNLFMVFVSPYLGNQYRVAFTNGEYCDYDLDEIEKL